MPTAITTDKVAVASENGAPGLLQADPPFDTYLPGTGFE